MKRRITAAAVAVVTAMSLGVAPAHAADTDWDNFAEGVEALAVLKEIADNGWGAIPNTNGAGEMVAGSIEAGSSGKDAYAASQAGWSILWIGLAAAAFGGIYQGAKQIGLVK
ncbi:hypothetical protein QVA66_09550 [Staphylococcus chromogenes]|nr:hypothetical protein [Staphylococcus chromogenes]